MSTDAEFHPRVLLIGASKPIGRAVTSRFTNCGGTVVGVSLESADDDALTADLIADCSDPVVASHAVQEAVEVLGGLDVLVAGAGAMPVAPAHRTTPEQWRIAQAASLDTFFYSARAALPHLTGHGAIVAVSSVNAFLAAPWLAAYAAAKGGVEALVRQLALDYGASGIRVNGVAPGLVDDGSIPGGSAGYPIRRPVRTTEVADAIAFLSSDNASGITGTILPVDGGLSIASPAAFTRPDLVERLDVSPLSEVSASSTRDSSDE